MSREIWDGRLPAKARMSKGTLRRGGAKKAFFFNGRTRKDGAEIIGKWVNRSIGESGDGKGETGDGR